MPAQTSTRSYRDGGLVLETVFTTPSGTVSLIDFMLPEAANSSVIRIVEGRSGTVAMQMELALRFDYGTSVPWVTRLDDGTGTRSIAGPEKTVLRTAVGLEGRDMQTVAEFTVQAGQRVPFVLSHGPSHLADPAVVDAEQALAATEHYWSEWSARCSYQGHYKSAVQRSLLVLKALTYAPTGGIVAAATTSLPEQLGGSRNWDYRYCWLRDATLTLFALMQAGYYEEAGAWRDWLHRSLAGSPEQIQIMYGLGGERRLAEWEVSWLPGYQGAAPVRIGNAASEQLQIDVFGEVTEALHQAREGGLKAAPESWSLQTAILEHLADIWEQPDEGIWETRGGRKHFTYSKVMAWVAFDRMVKDAETHGLEGDVARWREIRDKIHALVCEKGFHPGVNSFTQHFDSDDLDASLLLIPLAGFLPHDDPRVLGTTAAVERLLLKDGFVLRYSTDDSKDGPPTWRRRVPGMLVLAGGQLAHAGPRSGCAAVVREAAIASKRRRGCSVRSMTLPPKRMTGNFPQAFSHTALIASAMNLAHAGPAQAREAAE